MQDAELCGRALEPRHQCFGARAAAARGRSRARPLTHVATLALAELPDVGARDVLPADGYLSFFVALEDQDALREPIEPGDDRADLYAVVHTPAERPPHEPEGPGLRSSACSRAHVYSCATRTAGEIYVPEADVRAKRWNRVTRWTSTC